MIDGLLKGFYNILMMSSRVVVEVKCIKGRFSPRVILMDDLKQTESSTDRESSFAHTGSHINICNLPANRKPAACN